MPSRQASFPGSPETARQRRLAAGIQEREAEVLHRLSSRQQLGGIHQTHLPIIARMTVEFLGAMNTGCRVAAILLGLSKPLYAQQAPVVPRADEAVLREYAGVYQWNADAFSYLQLWSEFSGKNQLIVFDESGSVRTLYPIERDHFFAGAGAAVATKVESRIDFQRDHTGKIVSLTWRDEASPRFGQRVDIERREDVRFSDGEIQL